MFKTELCLLPSLCPPAVWYPSQYLICSLITCLQENRIWVLWFRACGVQGVGTTVTWRSFQLLTWCCLAFCRAANIHFLTQVLAMSPTVLSAKKTLLLTAKKKKKKPFQDPLLTYLSNLIPHSSTLFLIHFSPPDLIPFSFLKELLVYCCCSLFYLFPHLHITVLDPRTWQ